VSDQPLLRLCARCQLEKPLDEFPIKNAARGTYRSYCRPCCSESGKEHYRKNVAAYLLRARTRSAIDRPGNRKLIADYLSSRACVDCGERDPVVLEFDHRDPTSKTDDVGRLVHTGSRATVQAEIEKCDVRCVNCHRRRTAQQFGWHKSAR
jgi:hypothetical protein